MQKNVLVVIRQVGQDFGRPIQGNSGKQSLLLFKGQTSEGIGHLVRGRLLKQIQGLVPIFLSKRSSQPVSNFQTHMAPSYRIEKPRTSVLTSGRSSARTYCENSPSKSTIIICCYGEQINW